jgi:hypothetical protein
VAGRACGEARVGGGPNLAAGHARSRRQIQRQELAVLGRMELAVLLGRMELAPA